MIYYMSGRLSGNFALEPVDLNGLQVNAQAIGFAEDINVPILDDVVWDGIVGLAFANKKLKQMNIKPLFDTIIGNVIKRIIPTKKVRTA